MNTMTFLQVVIYAAIEVFKVRCVCLPWRSLTYILVSSVLQQLPVYSALDSFYVKSDAHSLAFNLSMTYMSCVEFAMRKRVTAGVKWAANAHTGHSELPANYKAFSMQVSCNCIYLNRRVYHCSHIYHCSDVYHCSHRIDVIHLCA
jgi:hypothetical protein